MQLKYAIRVQINRPFGSIMQMVHFFFPFLPLTAAAFRINTGVYFKRFQVLYIKAGRNHGAELHLL